MHLVEVNQQVAGGSPAGPQILQGKSEIHPRRVRDIKAVSVVLIPLLDGSKYLFLICADDMHVLCARGEEKDEEEKVDNDRANLKVKLLRLILMVLLDKMI